MTGADVSQGRGRFWRHLWFVVAALMGIAALSLLCAVRFLSVFQVSGTSMSPTLREGDVLFMIRTDLAEPGDLVGFYCQNSLLLKRVIAGPGDWVDLDSEGNVSVNQIPLEEPYVTEAALGENDREYPYQVPEGAYFVMGDNRSVSLDSRSTAVGCVDRDQMVGRVVLCLWPLDRIRLFRSTS